MARDNQLQIRCRSCARELATVSHSGLVLIPPAEGQGCDTCQQFEALFKAMEAADNAYASFSGRRDNYGPKCTASANFRKAHIDFHNWLLAVEAVEDKQESMPHGEVDAAAADKQQHQGTKRSRSQSPTPETSVSTSSPDCGSSTVSLPKRKRLKFSQTVEFREEHRPCQQFSRTEEEYVRGRYAPPEGSGYLDTSGSFKSFLKFTGMKKIKDKWIDVWEDDDDGDEKKSKKKSTHSAAAEEDSFEETEEQPMQTDDQNGSVDARAERLARRRRITTRESDPRRKDIAIKTRAKGIRGAKREGSDPDREEVAEPASCNTSSPGDTAHELQDLERPSTGSEPIQQGARDIQSSNGTPQQMVIGSGNGTCDDVSGQITDGQANVVADDVDQNGFVDRHAHREQSGAVVHSTGTSSEEQQTCDDNMSHGEILDTSKDLRLVLDHPGAVSVAEETPSNYSLTLRDPPPERPITAPDSYITNGTA
jgi:hypothetical protein